MANTILLKSRQSDATQPAASGLKVGELAVNTFDGRVYLGTDTNNASASAGGTAQQASFVGAIILDENDLASDSDKHLATQQSIKKYVDDSVAALGSGDITAVVAGDGLSGGANSGSATLALDLNELTAATVAVGSDSIPIIDASDNSSKKESIADLVSGMAGSGLSASSGQLSLTNSGVTVADSDGNSTAIGLGSTMTFAGTSSEVEVSENSGTVTIGLPSNVNIGGTLTVGGIAATESILTSIDGNLTLNVNNGQVLFTDDGTSFARFANSGSNLLIRSEISDNDIAFQGKDGSGFITAGSFDMSDAGTFILNHDLKLDSDAAILHFGDDQDVTLTHVADTGLLLNSSRQLQFGDSGTYIHQSADGVLDLVADSEIEINATTVDINGAVEISGNLTVSGTTTTVDSTVVSIADPLFELGASGSDDNLDRGIIMKYNSSGAKKAFMGFDDSTGKFTMIPDATDSSAVISGTAGTLVMTTFEGALTGNVTGNVSGSSGSCTGNAATATALASSVTINGTAFDGTSNITLGNTSVTNAMLAGSIANSKLSNSTISGVALGSNLNALTVDDSSIELNSGTTFNGSAARTISVKDSGITNAMLAGSIANAKLANSAITIAGASTSLGGSISAATIAAAIDSETMTLTNTTISGGAYST